MFILPKNVLKMVMSKILSTKMKKEITFLHSKRKRNEKPGTIIFQAIAVHHHEMEVMMIVNTHLRMMRMTNIGRNSNWTLI